MVLVTMHFLPNACLHGYGNGRLTNTEAGVQDKQVFTFDRIKNGCLMERVHITLMSRVLVHTCE